jgi:hypothetical protein
LCGAITIEPPGADRRWIVGWLFIFLFADPTAGRAQGPDLQARRDSSGVADLRAAVIRDPITVDGALNERAWTELPVWSEFLQRSPAEGQAPTERTEVQVGYNADALYVGIRAFDETARVSRQLSRRDRPAVADSLSIYLDPRHDHLTGVLFTVSAAGVQSDASIDNDFEVDTTWDAVWESAVRLDNRGWVAEVRIQLSQLRFSSTATAVWGINVRRFIFRKNEDLWLQLVPRVENRVLASGFAHITAMQDVPPNPHLELLPYQATRLEAVDRPGRDAFDVGGPFGGSLGIDGKWGLTNTLTVDGTINPDFGQVELDPSVINLTEFETSWMRFGFSRSRRGALSASGRYLRESRRKGDVIVRVEFRCSDAAPKRFDQASHRQLRRQSWFRSQRRRLSAES